MSQPRLRFVLCGLSITSSWGNGHATTYRALIRELRSRGHEVLFLERDTYWYAANRDLPEPPYCRTRLYGSLDELKDVFTDEMRQADVVIVGSFVPDGAAVGEWVTSTARGIMAFYDIDTPVTLAKLQRGECEYLSAALIPRYDLYLSFTGGPALRTIERRYRSPRARVLYCSADPEVYFPQPQDKKWDLGYIGTHCSDRQPALGELMLAPARQWAEGRFIVAGPLYPKEIVWPDNVERRDHLSPAEHRDFYNSQKFTLNITRADMIRAGHSPSVRLFEAAACATPIISDDWEGLNGLFRIGRDILVARSGAQCLDYLRNIPDDARMAIGQNGRKRVLARHTAAHRAAELEEYVREIQNRPRSGAIHLSVSAAFENQGDGLVVGPLHHDSQGIIRT